MSQAIAQVARPYLSAEHAQQLANLKHAAVMGGSTPIRVRAAEGGWWQVRHGSHEQVMPPMDSDDWAAWVEHFFGQ